MKLKILLTITWCCLTTCSLSAQPLCSVVRYDETDGVPSSHVTQLLQDELGLMWFATWNGLCRYDGYEFRTFKPQVGDGCHMTTDRIRNMDLLETGNILCQVDEEYYIFDTHNYCFRDLTADEKGKVDEWIGKNRASRSLRRKPYTWTDNYNTQWTMKGNGELSYLDRQSGQQVVYALPIDFHAQTFAMADQRGNLWALDYGSIYKLTTDMQRTQRLDITPKAEAKCLFGDKQGRYWVATKDDKAVRIYSQADNSLLGFLSPDGRLHRQYTVFGAAVYCIYQQQDGTLWLGTKPDGIYRLRPKAGAYEITHITTIPNTDVYHLTEDRWGRLWAATLGGGVCYTDNPQAEQPHFTALPNYPKEASRARYLYINKDDILLVATSNGLLVSQLMPKAEQMEFRLHQREADRKESLSCSATMDVVQDGSGRYFVSTESGGVNLIKSNDLLAEKLAFQHIREQFHVQSNDVVQSLALTDKGGLVATGSHLVTLIDSTLQGRVLDVSNFNNDYRFSEAHPLVLPHGRWLFGLTDGAFITNSEQLLRQAYSPRVVLTQLTYQGTNGEEQEVRSNFAIERMDTLTLLPDERNITIHFAAIDYQNPERINYAFRLSADKEWSYIGSNRSITLLDLEPDTYVLEVRSTNADGEWLQNGRKLIIIVKPTFWESVWGQLLIVVIIIAILAAIVYTLLYIRSIKRKQHETLEAYLALLQQHTPDSPQPTVHTPTPMTEDPMLQRVMQFVEENISNSEAGVGDMASAAAVSRSGLQRKLKQAMGITPQDLMKEARIKRAQQLLRELDKNVAEVAYACGFSDPKYFSRSFKQSTGKSPTEYRDGLE